MMSEKNNEESYNKNPNDPNESNEDGEILTLSDILNVQREIDEEANAVLGGSDENFCTYSQGYIKRQALYACLTCVPESKEKPEKRAGVCLACSYKCHDGHELIELYTKRNFRCDCGTSKILAIRCKLDANKMEDNDKNTYNQNFSGVYCTCHRPYPDEQDDIQDEMIQCVFCEDWFHSRHLNSKVPDSNGFDEMICDACTLKNDFLNYYSGYCVQPSNNDEANTTGDSANELNVSDCEKNTNVDKKDAEKKDASLNAEINQCIQDIIEINKNNVQTENSTVTTNATTNATTTNNDATKRSSSAQDDIPSAKRAKLDEGASTSSGDSGNGGNGGNVGSDGGDGGSSSSSSSATINTNSNLCLKPTTILNKFTGASFWLIEWRTKLCRCSNCMEMYKKNDVEFLLDDEDTVHAYQEKGKAKAAENRVSLQEETMRALSGMDRVSQIEAVLAYNKLKKKLTEFLTSFVSNEQVVTAKDVDTFFQTMDKKD